MIRVAAFLSLILVAGCSVGVRDPTQGPLPGPEMECKAGGGSSPYRSWGIYSLNFDESHGKCTVVPVRAGAFHLNALKLLEEGPCTDCVRIQRITQQGGGIIDVDVTITHPYSNLAYSAFDVKGIIMFTAEDWLWESTINDVHPIAIYKFYISWWRHGDWELLNPDGWTFRWGLNWNPDAEYPILRYWPGKLSRGTPTSDINAYKNFYTDEARHLFRPNRSVTQTYTIKTQPGPLTVGYAVEACWEPPTKIPVFDPLTDFPFSANQPEPYLFNVVINDGEPVPEIWTLRDERDGSIKMYIEQWGDVTVNKANMWMMADYNDPGRLGSPVVDRPFVACYDPDADYYCGLSLNMGIPGDVKPRGWYRTVSRVYWGTGSALYHDHAFTVTDFLFDVPD